MGRGGKFGNQQFSDRRIRSKDKGSDQSDEDYTVGADEFEDSDEYCSSLAADESEDSLGGFEEEEEEEEVRKVGRSKRPKRFPGRKKNGDGKARNKRKVSYKEENDEDYEDEYCDEDDDDEEFTHEIDLDDEDEMAVRKNNKKVGRPPLGEKGFVKGRKRKRNCKVMRKTPTKSRGLQSKSAASNVGAFTKKNPVVKERSVKNSCPRKRRFVLNSDSDFMDSGSTDFECSMSDEEREQMREASEFCGDLTISLRSSSLKKRLQEGVLCQQRKRLARKGKEKVEDLKNKTGKQVCGICLSEEGKKTVCGTLNCCSHYFCFPCIMEWSKVESRCPLCKQRFVTISKPARSSTGFDLRTVVVQVPERDQIYQPSEEELRGYLDPYENVICTECQQGGDDAFMLLCDLCDSPAHTYCVGLECEVPEGNWYCEGCRPTALGSSNPQAPNPTTDQRTINELSGRSSPVENVREAIDLNTTYVPETPLAQGTGVFSSPRRPGGDFQAASPVPGAGVLTVSERRRIQRQIHHLLNNRLSQLGGRTNGMLATTLGSNLLGSQIGLGREISFQHSMIPETVASHRTFSQGRLQDNFAPLVQNRNFVPARSNHSRGQLIQCQTSTSADGSVNGMLQAGISMGINSTLGYDQLHPCSSRPGMGDATMSPYRYREATVPSRTLQGTPHTPF